MIQGGEDGNLLIRSAKQVKSSYLFYEKMPAKMDNIDGSLVTLQAPVWKQRKGKRGGWEGHGVVKEAIGCLN